MWCIHYPSCITRCSWHSVATQLTINFRMGPWRYNFLFCQWRLAIPWLWITVSKSLTNYLIQKAKFRWGSMDDHFQNVKVTVPLALLMIKAATMFVIHNRKHIPFQSPKLHYQRSLTLCWHAVKGGSDIDTNHIANKGCQTSNIHTGRIATLGLYIMQCPKWLTLFWYSVDALLRLCWRSVDVQCQVKWRWHYRFCLYRWPICWIWINTVAQPFDDTRCNTQNRWHSVDAHFQTGAVTMSPSLLPIKAANTLIFGKCCSTALGLYKMQYPRLLMLDWHSIDALLMLCWCSVPALLTLSIRWSDIDINHIA